LNTSSGANTAGSLPRFRAGLECSQPAGRSDDPLTTTFTKFAPRKDRRRVDLISDVVAFRPSVLKIRKVFRHFDNGFVISALLPSVVRYSDDLPQLLWHSDVSALEETLDESRTTKPHPLANVEIRTQTAKVSQKVRHIAAGYYGSRGNYRRRTNSLRPAFIAKILGGRA
jgi:hypothetical protein